MTGPIICSAANSAITERLETNTLRAVESKYRHDDKEEEENSGWSHWGEAGEETSRAAEHGEYRDKIQTDRAAMKFGCNPQRLDDSIVSLIQVSTESEEIMFRARARDNIEPALYEKSRASLKGVEDWIT